MLSSKIITILKQSETYIRNPYSPPVCQPTALHEEDSRKHSVYGLTKLQSFLSFPLRHCPFLLTLQPQERRTGTEIIQPSNFATCTLAADVFFFPFNKSIPSLSAEHIITECLCPYYITEIHIYWINLFFCGFLFILTAL